jgi:hypothetical protein
VPPNENGSPTRSRGLIPWLDEPALAEGTRELDFLGLRSFPSEMGLLSVAQNNFSCISWFVSELRPGRGSTVVRRRAEVGAGTSRYDPPVARGRALEFEGSFRFERLRRFSWLRHRRSKPDKGARPVALGGRMILTQLQSRPRTCCQKNCKPLRSTRTVAQG